MPFHTRLCMTLFAIFRDANVNILVKYEDHVEVTRSSVCIILLFFTTKQREEVQKCATREESTRDRRKGYFKTTMLTQIILMPN